MDKQIHREVIRYTNGGAAKERIQDAVVTEFPVTIKLNEQEFATMVCSPEYMEEMVIGFLASEAVIKTYDDIQELWIDENEGFAHVKVEKMNDFYQKFRSKRYVTSCCGMSRQSFYFFNDAMTAKKQKDVNLALSPQDCFAIMSELQQSADFFKQTGGVHNAALFNKDGIMLSRMDIGRHNALDKIYGHCIKQKEELRGTGVVFSGRVSSEILLKVSKIGCEIILSKSAPTELALKLAEELGITVVGFIRNGSMNVYTHEKRIVE